MDATNSCYKDDTSQRFNSRKPVGIPAHIARGTANQISQIFLTHFQLPSRPLLWQSYHPHSAGKEILLTRIIMNAPQRHPSSVVKSLRTILKMMPLCLCTRPSDTAADYVQKSLALSLVVLTKVKNAQLLPRFRGLIWADGVWHETLRIYHGSKCNRRGRDQTANELFRRQNTLHLRRCS